jgi:protoporphyrinogen oxidase
MKVAIIGGGITGLTTGFYLGQKNHQVVVFEKMPKLGGLALGFKKSGWRWSLEYFPHHLFVSDKAARELIDQLGIFDRLFFKRPKTSVFLKGRIFQFDSATAILKAPFFSPLQKAWIGLVTFYLKTTSNWRLLEKEAAPQWLSRVYGKAVTEKLWQPLLRGKFESEAGRVNMAWLWGRIKKRSSRLGYLRGGFQILIDSLEQEIKKSGGEIVLGKKVQDLVRIRKNFDKVVVTTAMSVFLKIAPDLPLSYRRRIEKLKMIGALDLVLILKEPFLKRGTYWLNINEKNFPFVFVDEHTNFVDSRHYGKNYLVYVGGYYRQNHHYFKMGKEELLSEFLPYLKRINPGFKRATILSFEKHAKLDAQPVTPVNYSSLVPGHKTPLENVYLTNMQQIYPWDRGVNYAIEAGKKMAEMISQEGFPE